MDEETPLIVNYPGFDFQRLLHATVEREQYSFDKLFSLSPFTTDDEIDEENPPPPFTSACISNVPLPQSDSTLASSLAPAIIHDACSSKDAVSPKQSHTLSRKARKRKQSHANRDKKRGSLREQLQTTNKVKKINAQKHLKNARPVTLLFDPQKSKVVSTGFTGCDDKTRSSTQHTLDEVVGKNSKFKFKLQPWDGRTVMPLLDNYGTVFGVCAGRPDDKNWDNLQKMAADALEQRRDRCHVPQKERKNNRRGRFVNLRCGVSHGGGQKMPKNLGNGKRNQEVLEELNSMEPFRRLAGFASNVMATWAPDLHDYYTNTLSSLYENYESLTRTFKTSVLPATTYNMGPQTVCFKHCDFNNLSFGWCAISALGSYDPQRGGHLILWDCGVVIEFPPGSTILIPSAIIAHSNTRIGAGETRYSFTQYAAGGLFRWVENNFMKATSYQDSLTSWPAVLYELKNKTRWRFGLSLLSTYPGSWPGKQGA